MGLVFNWPAPGHFDAILPETDLETIYDIAKIANPEEPINRAQTLAMLEFELDLETKGLELLLREMSFLRHVLYPSTRPTEILVMVVDASAS